MSIAEKNGIDTDDFKLVDAESSNGIRHMEYWVSDSQKNKLLYAFTSSQIEARQSFISDSHTDITDVRGQVRSGKSVACARFILSLAWSHNSSEWAVVSKSLKEGGRATYNLLFSQLPDCDPDNPSTSPIVDNYNATEKRLKLINGSKIYLTTSNKPASLKGTELNGVWMDEIAFYNDLLEIVNVSFERLSATPRYGMITSTTAEGFGDYYKIFEKQINPQTAKALDMNIDTIHLDLSDNVFVDSSRKEEIKRASSREHLGGEFSADEGRVYSKFAQRTHVVSKSDIDIVDGWRIYSYDSGWNDPRVVLEIGKTPYDELVVLDEFYRSESTVGDAIDWMSKKPSGKIYSEHEPAHVEKFRNQLGYSVDTAYKNIDAGISAVQDRLSADDTDRYGLLVCESCDETIDEFLTYKTSDVGSSTAKDHAMDCIRYAIATPQSSELKNSTNRQMYAVKTSKKPSTDIDSDSEDEDKGGVPYL